MPGIPSVHGTVEGRGSLGLESMGESSMNALSRHHGEFDRVPTTSRRALLGALSAAILVSRPRSASAQCTRVELYPGYPGFQGYVTGVDGVGDSDCIDDLTAANPGFDPAYEDEMNVHAAAGLGIAGVATEWTWENWMAIEAARGLPPTCFSCALMQAGSRYADPGSFSDPRIAIGTNGTTYLVTLTGAPINFVGDDLGLRALMGLFNPFRYLNASDILYNAQAFVENTFFTAGNYADPNALVQNLLAQGGYAPTPYTALPDDQIFMFTRGYSVILPFYNSYSRDLLSGQVSRLVDDWKFALLQNPATAGSLADWARAHWS